MSLSPTKQEILESMLLCEIPEKAVDIAKAAHKEFQPVMMHLLGLTKMGYVTSPKKGLYIITARGKQTLGILEITKEKAAAILTYLPHDKAFHFYATVDKPLSMHAHNLRDFTSKIEKADCLSLEFHLKRGDFEAWFKGLGDEELAKKMALLRKRNLQGKELKDLLNCIVDNRYRSLTKLTGQVFPENETKPDNEHEHVHTHEDGSSHMHLHSHSLGNHVHNST